MMFSDLARDLDGFVDLDLVPEVEVDLDLVAWPVPPLDEDVWELIVTSASRTDPDELDIEVDELTGGLQNRGVEDAVGGGGDWASDAAVAFEPPDGLSSDEVPSGSFGGADDELTGDA
jgi:hypothetical protein